ncbi:MAG: hypothetical protein KKG76_00825 [Euryarchaeota archaeon]|nr:hypothetical protein [Euryarchaeota archaeon]
MRIKSRKGEKKEHIFQRYDFYQKHPYEIGASKEFKLSDDEHSIINCILMRGLYTRNDAHHIPEEIMQRILDMPQKQAIELGVDRSTFQRMKRRIEKDHEINLNTPAVKRLMAKTI